MDAERAQEGTRARLPFLEACFEVRRMREARGRARGTGREALVTDIIHRPTTQHAHTHAMRTEGGDTPKCYAHTLTHATTHQFSP
jgi:hypothetical protein